MEPLKALAVTILAVIGIAAFVSDLRAFESVAPEIVDYYETSVWQVWDMERTGFGSAFAIGPGYYITNAHVTKGGYSMQMTREGDVSWVTTDVVGENQEMDIALMYCHECVEMEQTYVDITWPITPPRGTMTWGGGYGGGQLSLHTGILQSLRAGYIWTDTTMTNGDSGSPETVWENGLPILVGIRAGGLQQWKQATQWVKVDGQWVSSETDHYTPVSNRHKGYLIPTFRLRQFLREIGHPY